MSRYVYIVYLHSYATLATTSNKPGLRMTHVTCHVSHVTCPPQLTGVSLVTSKLFPLSVLAACCLLLPKHIRIYTRHWTRSTAFPRRPGPGEQAAAAQQVLLSGRNTSVSKIHQPLSSRDLLPWKYAASLMVLNFRTQPPRCGCWWVARHMWGATPAPGGAQ